MPTTYAHYVFGSKIITILPNHLKNIVNANRDIFDIAVHGPDALYYDLKNKKVCDVGYSMHRTSMKQILAEFKIHYQKNINDDSYLTYFIGFLSHYVLDAVCHSYIESKVFHSRVSHNLVESQYDAYLIMLEHQSTTFFDRSSSLKPNNKTAKIMAELLDLNEDEIYRSLKAQKNVIKMLNDHGAIIDYLKIMILKTINFTKYTDLLLKDKPDPRCLDANLRLDKLQTLALKYFPNLLNNMLAYFEDKSDLDGFFNNHFENRDNYKDIPVLSYEDELKYEVSEE